MRNHGPWAFAAAAAFILLCTASVPADAMPAYSKAKAEVADGKTAAPGPSGTVSASAEPEAKQAAADAGGAGTPCGCGCPHCKEYGHMHGRREMPRMTERMKVHLEERKKAVSELRESEKAVEGAADLETLRKAVLSHLKRIDDLQESHLRHLESMMEARHGMMKGHPYCPDCPCR